MEYIIARQLAESICYKLIPFCERIKIAGSIRRKSKEVSDIDLVVIPKRTATKDMFGNVTGWKVNEGFIAQINSWPKIKGEPTGKLAVRQLPEGIHLEISITNEFSWGYLLAIRTGPADYSHRLAKRWRKLGFEGHDGVLTNDGRPIALPTEEKLFALLDIPYIEPCNRV